ncbi:hypothetical protein G4X40_18555 [Rhodococcus sp. D2-41]|uniref:hypothetical protein n=1 Tax=Speluncibacter jeojiensis TaxID=2710754 RepID=UPI00240FE036|nr:hypothetical protein [Rhodococcus sp. D2-41]MDG3012147.1 hypothetical protein [Rhodococcus sp. D2-41]
MTRPLRFPADAAGKVKDHLAARLAATDPGVTVALNLPATWTPDRPAHVAVFDDGGAASWPVATHPMIRVTVWAKGRSAARAVASRCMGFLLADRIPGVAHTTEPSALLDARDGDNHAAMASFLLRVTIRTTA